MIISCDAFRVLPLVQVPSLSFLIHTELSEVLWTMGIDKAVAPGARDPVLGAIALFFIWAAWAGEL